MTIFKPGRKSGRWTPLAIAVFGLIALAIGLGYAGTGRALAQAVPEVAANCHSVTNDVLYQGEHWQQFECVPMDSQFQFNRIDIQVGKPDQALKVRKAHFACQSNPLDSKVVGDMKGRLNNVNPPPLTDHELWSGRFSKKCTGSVDVYLQPVDSLNKLVIKEASVSNPPEVAASCHSVTNDVLYQGEHWQQFECVPMDPQFQFNRIDIQVGKPDQATKVLKAHFACQSNPLDSKVVGDMKGRLNDVNPPPLTDHELWSGDFGKKCTGGVDVYLQPVNSQNKLVIKEASVSNPPKVGGIVVDQDTGALQLQSDSSSSSDAWLLTAGLAVAGALVLSSGAWYVRRRRVR